MASDFPLRPKLLKGALAVYESDKAGAQPKVIVFQYNPELLKRTLADRTPQNPPGNTGIAKEDVMRVVGPPVETISMTVAMDAVYQPAGVRRGLNERQGMHQEGLHQALSTLEMLLYPPTLRVHDDERLAQHGAVQIAPEKLPLTLLIWGAARVIPVLLTNFTVTEEAFDTALNPIQAKVELSMRVLTYLELKEDGLGRNAYFAYQRQKETFAQAYSAGGDIKQTTGFDQSTYIRPGAE